MANKNGTTQLTSAQARVMDWLNQGWSARVSNGSAVEVNGKRICNVDTMAALVRFGLVSRDSGSGYWNATDAGKKIRPNFLEPSSHE
ncbi:hypothetical protein [Pseudomonas sp. MWU12-2323]|uniref:hypothetical protein n=1 Tax=Pseudomonas sp. MWU12-2323 TaxID=2651296 RepID=UPI00128CB8CA|nr:hypothetical protein [Pseudomonas sp. MWU12-2323]MPQ69244.1 hypothetical protein [Pseudomonas sp. MWU12-2323]